MMTFNELAIQIFKRTDSNDIFEVLVPENHEH